MGSRGFKNYELLKKTILRYYCISKNINNKTNSTHIERDMNIEIDDIEKKKPLITAIVSGGADGTDRLGK